MNTTYVLTPEMLGITWRRILTRTLSASALAVLSWGLCYSVFHHRPPVGSLIGLEVAIVVCALLMRPLSRARLRITNDSIERSDGPVIRKDEIYRVNEYPPGHQVPGIEIIANRKPLWLRGHRIFVPAALPDYQEVKRIVHEWADRVISAQQ